MRTLAALAIVVLAQNAAFMAICVTKRPEQETMGMFFLSWMTIPAFTAAIGEVNQRRIGLASGIASVVNVACWDYLLVAEGLFCDQSHVRVPLAIGFGIAGITIGLVCAGFIQTIVNAIELSVGSGRSPVSAGLKKGATFGTFCSLVAAALFFLLGPTHSGRGPKADAIRHQINQECAVTSVALLIVGMVVASILGGVVGSIYRRPPQAPDQAP